MIEKEKPGIYLCRRGSFSLIFLMYLDKYNSILEAVCVARSSKLILEFNK
jgi:hypothetical protein